MPFAPPHKPNLTTLNVLKRCYNNFMNTPAPSGRLIILCGLPGSGKTTFSKALEAKLGAIGLDADEWMDALGIDLWDEASRAKVEALQWRTAQQLLARGLTVVIAWGTWGRSERDQLRLGARDLGAAVELHYLTATPDELFERVRRRGSEHPPFTRENLLDCIEKIQVPTREESALFDPPLMKLADDS